MKNYLLHRLFKTANNVSTLLFLILELVIVYFVVVHDYNTMFICLALYLFAHVIFIYPKKTANSFGFHTKRGMYIILSSIYNRKGIMTFYIAVYVISYYMLLYIIATTPLLGVMIFALVFLGKLAMYYACYKLSYSTNSYPEFDAKLR